jgi:hypothetical protein
MLADERHAIDFHEFFSEMRSTLAERNVQNFVGIFRIVSECRPTNRKPAVRRFGRAARAGPHYTIMARENWNMGIYFPEGQEIFPKAQPEGIS